MRFIVDACAYVQVVDSLRDDGHEVTHVRYLFSDSSDEDLLRMANTALSILVSEDRDFGDLIVRDGCPANGVVIVKVAEFRGSPASLGSHIADVVRQLGQDCIGQFIVVEPGRERRRSLPGAPP